MNNKTTITLDRNLKNEIAVLGSKGDSFEKILGRLLRLAMVDRKLFNEITKEETKFREKENVEN